jgi:hypothetical protein
MDVSTEYIQMCEKAEEIQADHKWEYGDWLVAEYGIFQIGTASFNYSKDPTVPPVRSELPVATIQSDDNEGSAFTGKLIWLPTQDRLHVLSDYTWMDFDKKCLMVQDNFGFLTKEQAGIMVVMKEKFNKIWSGSEWVNEKER